MLLNFGYLIPQQLAGMGRPPDGGYFVRTIELLAAEGIGALVTLTESPLDVGALDRAGFDYLHLPVEDFTAPTLDQVEAFVRFARASIEAGRPVAVHCMAGLGRTGTMLACYLVHLGASPRDALDRVRTLRPGSVEVAEQEDVIRRYAELLSREGPTT